MKSVIAASLVALGIGTFAVSMAKADDIGDRVGRGIVRGLAGDYDHPGWRHRHWDEGRSDYEGGGCRTIIINRQTPDGEITKRIRKCD